ncbi:AAA family ATPase [Candidatus Marsarchaeota G2 archaeon OSP_D]|nr:MAG: AAA family ATPase [Candidatus Marsarchaeota G2 archaeon OSP_D]PSN95166.1 MAG: AAA family ATPase [Candidatus Marsarchaeota G2 archaeon ECH_B_2]PSN99782.1 MAG: AAA family ATPase [Candidatus Marsarchaeota G2 archaeon ECH_B_3]PSO01997.1 MAG: AAA family ATPase [Candidatus Marsarchaeota G2 archaeon ECH_B_1]
MEELGLSANDPVLAIGYRRTGLIVLPSDSRDYGRRVMKVDEETLLNMGVTLGDRVVVRKIEPKTAERIVLGYPEDFKGQPDLREVIISIRGRPLCRGNIISVRVGGKIINSAVEDYSPQEEAVVVGYNTKIEMIREPSKVQPKGVPLVTFEDIGGLTKQIQKLRELVELPLLRPELFRTFSIRPPKGILLYGPPGTGKTLIARAVANTVKANFYLISGPEIGSKYYGESEKRLRDIFKEAEKTAPSIIFVDEIDSLAPSRDNTSTEVERRIVSQLLTLMDGLSPSDKVVVIGATNRPNAVDPALRRPGRFDREIEIPAPDAPARLEILRVHTRRLPLASDVNMEEIAELTNGFVGADLAALVREATLQALKRKTQDLLYGMSDLDLSIAVTRSDFLAAIKEIEPSALREFRIEVPTTKWDDVVGLQDVKRELMESIEWPLKYPELYTKINAELPKGILLYGPPGTGKTLIARAVASESRANFITVTSSDLLSKWVGESEKALREVFRRAKQAAPCIIFFDEIEALAPVRSAEDNHVSERLVSQLLTELDGLVKLNGVVVMAATNRPELVDPALLRPGRFDKILYVPLPDLSARSAIIKLYVNKHPHDENIDYLRLSQLTEGYSGADLKGVVDRAVQLAIREYIELKEKDGAEPKLRAEHLLEALKTVKPSQGKSIELVRSTQTQQRFGVS